MTDTATPKRTKALPVAVEREQWAQKLSAAVVAAGRAESLYATERVRAERLSRRLAMALPILFALGFLAGRFTA